MDRLIQISLRVRGRTEKDYEQIAKDYDIKKKTAQRKALEFGAKQPGKYLKKIK